LFLLGVVVFGVSLPAHVAHTSSSDLRLQSNEQQDATRLESGKPLKQDITGGKSQSFLLSLDTNQYARVLVEQHGIILSVQLLDLEGRPVVEMDNPAGGHGPIYLSAIAPAPGDYRVIVTSTEPWANPGQFVISIEDVHPAAPADKDRVAAEKAFADGRQLANKGTKESREAAIIKYKEALTYWDAVSEPHWQAMTMYSLARVYRGLSQYDKAEEIYQQMTRFSFADHDWRLEASYFNDRGLNFSDQSKFDPALQTLNLAFARYDSHNDNRGRASALNNIGLTYHRMGALANAMENYEKAIPLRRTENDQQGEFNVRNNIGGIYDVSGEPVKALEQYQATLKVWQEIDSRGGLRDRDQLGTNFNNVGEALNKLGRWQEARDHYQEAFKIFDKSGNGRGQAAVLDNLGQLYQDLGDTELALDHYRKALTLLQGKFKNAELEANVLSHIGTVSMSQNDLDVALQNFQRALELRQNDRGKAYAMLNIGAVYALKKTPQQALPAYRDALQLIRKAKDQRGEALVLYKTGEVEEMLGDHAQALVDLNQSRLLWGKIADARGEAIALQAAARVEARLGQLSKALEDSAKAIGIVESLRTNILGSRLRASYFATQQTSYELNIGLNMQAFAETGSPQYKVAAFQASEKARARTLIDTLREARVTSIHDTADAALERELQQRLNAKAQAQTNLLNRKHTEQQASAFGAELNGLINQYNELQAKIIASNPRYADLVQAKTPGVPDIQSQLGNDTVLLEYSLGDERSYVWVVTANSIDGFQLPPRAAIESAATRITKALADRRRTVDGETPAQWERRREQAEKEFNTASAQLSDKIIRPLAPLLGTKRLLVVADGALQLVSFAALPVPGAIAQTPRRLIDDHEIVYEPSASVLALQRSELADRKRAPHAVAILADPVFGIDDPRVAAQTERNPSSNTQPKSPEIATRTGDVSRALEDVGLERFPRLRSSAVEAQKIVDVAPKGESKTALEFDATRETALSRELSEYRIVHFATHAVVNFEHPELSGMVFSLVDRRGQPRDGYVRLHDIYNLNLPADLVVLSACQTGVGKEIKGEGLIALTRGFMYAGAERVVASLWKVDDVATADLMAEFYRQIFANGQRPAGALRAAQLKLAKKRSPADWAGFVLQGEWK
jgi:CHAT domain-containing protein/tetratricopeptide (TPR) repeat protein